MKIAYLSDSLVSSFEPCSNLDGESCLNSHGCFIKALFAGPYIFSKSITNSRDFVDVKIACIDLL